MYKLCVTLAIIKRTPKNRPLRGNIDQQKNRYRCSGVGQQELSEMAEVAIARLIKWVLAECKFYS